jgi:alkylation response protein AidB-like acyl-CoA dehydrogenase
VSADWAQILGEISARAVAREQARELPFKEVELLRRAGFGALRVPVEHGGAGWSLTEFSDLLIQLGRAESNLPQLLRGHIGFTELIRADRRPEVREFWFGQLVDGALVANAQSERGSSLLAPRTELTREGDDWTIEGRKYYSTGSIFEPVKLAEEAGSAVQSDFDAADSAVFSAQGVVIDLTLQAASQLFRVGGASQTSASLALDRHWRNARTIASHNPEVFRARAVGAHLLNGEPPGTIPVSFHSGSPHASSV